MKNFMLAKETPPSKKRILIVEDDFLMRELLKFKLSKRGFEVATAKNEKEFWYAAFKENPNLILLDLWLANKIGVDIYDRLIDFGFDPQIPVIFITGYIQTGSPRPIRIKKNQVFLSKPFDFDQLMIAVNQFLDKSVGESVDAHRLHAAERGGDFRKSVYLRR